MTRLTRRGALGFGAAGLGLAACATPSPETSVPAFGHKVAFEHGVASGDPTQTSVILWTRVTTDAPAAVPVTWIVARDPEFKQVVKRGTTSTGPERDYTVKVDADGLEAGQLYYYYFLVGLSLIHISEPTRPY